jgi:hypothetical protein
MQHQVPLTDVPRLDKVLTGMRFEDLTRIDCSEGMETSKLFHTYLSPNICLLCTETA